MKLFFFLIVFGLVAGGGVAWWSGQPLQMEKKTVEFSVGPTDGAAGVARKLAEAGVTTSPTLLQTWLTLTGQASRFKKGSYELRPNDTPRSLLRKLVRGEFGMRSVRIGEGWNIRQVRAAMRDAEDLRHDSGALSDTTLMQKLGAPEGTKAEGMFFPDTYKYARNTSDLDILKLAYDTMQRKLDAAWQSRDMDLPLETPYELLKLASIVEKETGYGPDRTLVSAVMVNRLRINMRLQTDPTVIYGMGEAYDGNITRADLQRDTPYNTYTRLGLPPTPIAMPSEAALAAAANPADSKALYFVSRNDGTGASEFSENLEAHNRAVRKYILKRP
ncbi:MAG: endolytic transglycosylase MltG [Brachymonas sp.]|nr:endolytic transglycosylase MltG [Brachymonas sp.]